MKTKFLAFILVACLLFPSISVEATTTPTLSAPNYSVTYKGLSGTVSIPFSGYYNITVAGSQGGTYGSTRAAGNKVSGKVWLNKGDLVSYSCKTSPTAYTVNGSTMDVPAGNGGSLLINNKEFIYAAPGVSTTKAYSVPTGVNKVTLHRTGTAEPQSFNVHWHSGSASSKGGCYNLPYWYYSYEVNGSHSWGDDHTHGNSYTGVPDKCRTCSGCGAHSSDVGWGDTCSGNKETKYGYVESYSKPTGGQHISEYHLDCGYQQGHILNLYNLAQATSLVPAGFTETKAANSDSAYFTLQLAEHNGLYNLNTVAKTVGYNNYKYNVVVNNDVVVYCKHGILN